LKRPLENGVVDDAGHGERDASPVEAMNGTCDDDAGGNSGHEVKIKYRDPLTNETWTGRGRMASWPGPSRCAKDAPEPIFRVVVFLST
jgi:H-NS histone family protein